MTSVSVREEVARFARVMEAKLRVNDHKAHWRDTSIMDLLIRLREEVDELAQEVVAGTDPLAIVFEAADVADIAMMIADNACLSRKGGDT